MDLKPPRSMAKAWAGGYAAGLPAANRRMRLVRLSPDARRISLPLPVSLALHALLLALLLISFTPRKPELSLPLNGVSVVFEGTPQDNAVNAAPSRRAATEASPPKELPKPPPFPAPPRLAFPKPLPPPPAPPEPQVIQAEPDVHLAPIVPEPFQPPEAPSPRFIVPPPQVQKMPRPAPRRPQPHYLVLNGMSFNGPAAPPVLNPGHRGLDLQPANENAKEQADLVEIQGHVGAGWDSALKRWAREHGYYPDAAARLGQQGDVTVDLTIDRFGRVVADHLVKGSESAFLNMAWFGLWRDAKVPPFPPGTKDDTVKIRFTARYMLIP